MRAMKIALGLLLLCAFTNSANADQIIKRYEVINHLGGDHGLWTNGTISPRGPGNINNFFSISTPGTLIEYMDGTERKASLNFTATNIQGIVATVDLDFSGFLDVLSPTSRYKKEQGGSYNGLLQDFYETIDSGTISFVGGSLDGTSVNIDILEDQTAANTFQLGMGANAKDSELGASTWINSSAGLPGGTSHWDVNVSLRCVPEPGTFALIATGLLAFVPARRRRS